MIKNNERAAEWLRVGIVGKAHGLRGSFFVSGRDELIPASCKTLRVGATAESGSILTITENRWQAGRPILSAKECKRREDAEAIAGQALWMERSQLVVDQNSEYLWVDLPGRQVLTVAGEDFGEVREVYNVGASDILELVDTAGRVYDVPLIADYFDMQSATKPGPLRLAVEASTLDDLCQDNKSST